MLDHEAVGTRRRTGARARNGVRFKHDALLYDSPGDFVARMTAFVRDGLDAGEHTIVMVTPDKIARLRDALGAEATSVRFEDMSEIGRNPGRIIPAWREIWAESSADGRSVRGIGEPIWASRPADELIESQRHEELLNLAFKGAAGWLLCPYDTETLHPLVIDEARRSHPIIYDGVNRRRSAEYRGLADIARPFDKALPPPPLAFEELAFEAGELHEVRRFVEERARRLGLGRDRVGDLVLAASEAAANSLRHGGGSGSVRMWRANRVVVCEVTDGGRMDAPLAGRRRPSSTDEGGFGLWLVNQFCDLVQVRSLPSGTVVRMHQSLD